MLTTENQSHNKTKLHTLCGRTTQQQRTETTHTHTATHFPPMLQATKGMKYHSLKQAYLTNQDELEAHIYTTGTRRTSLAGISYHTGIIQWGKRAQRKYSFNYQIQVLGWTTGPCTQHNDTTKSLARITTAQGKRQSK